MIAYVSSPLLNVAKTDRLNSRTKDSLTGKVRKAKIRRDADKFLMMKTGLECSK